MLLADIRRIFDEMAMDRLSSGDLINALVADEARPWHDYREQGCRISNKQLARLLRVFDIAAARSVRIGDRTPRGYMRATFEDAFDRYLPSGGPTPAPAATSATSTQINSLQSEIPQHDPQLPLPQERNEPEGSLAGA